MADACSIPTREQLHLAEIMDSAKRALMEKVHAAVAEAAMQVRGNVPAADLDPDSEIAEYFCALVHQQMYLTICGADVETFEGGDVGKAIAIIRNQQQIANYYWGADMAVTPQG